MRAAGLLLAAAAAFAAPAPAPAPDGDCASAYDAAYEKQWRLPRSRWEKDCEEGRTPKDILKDRQGDFVHECRFYYANNKGDSKIPDWKIQTECAQGEPGERRLSQLTGAPFREPPKPKVPPARRLYKVVEAHGLVSKTPMDLLPPGKPHRYLPIAPFKVWRLDSENSPVCVIDTKRLDPETLAAPMICADGSSMPRFIVDTGCTGLRESMSFKNIVRADPPETCDQADIDRLAAGIEKVLIKGGSAE